MFGPVVGSVVESVAPLVSKLALGIAAAKQMESHVYCFGLASLDVVGNNTVSCAVVGLDGCRRLLVAHLFEELSHGNCFAGIDVKGAKFGFGCPGHDGRENLGDVEDGTVVGWIINIGRAEKMSTNTAARERFATVGCITVNSKYHVASLVC